MNKNLQSALKKSSPWHERQWHGHMTGVEILELMNLGVQSTFPDRDFLEEDKRKGVSQSYWFYYTPSKKRQELLPQSAGRRHDR